MEDSPGVFRPQSIRNRTPLFLKIEDVSVSSEDGAAENRDVLPNGHLKGRRGGDRTHEDSRILGETPGSEA